MRKAVFAKSLQVLAFVFFASCFAAAQSAALTPADKTKIFEKVWETVNRKYYDPSFNGVDWNGVREAFRPQIAAAQTDAEFFQIIKQMVGELGDAHTSFMTPAEARLYDKKQAVGTGLQIAEIAGKLVVVQVNPYSEANGKVEPGAIITTIDGRDAATVFDEARRKIKSSSARAVQRLAFREILNGEPDSQIRLGLIDRSGAASEAVLTRRVVARTNLSVEARSLPSGVGYIKFDRFESKIVKPFKKALEDLKDTKGLVIDLRANGGGEINAVLKMSGMLFGERVLFGKFQTRSGGVPKILGFSLIPEQAFVGGEDKQIYAQPIVVLTSERSASGAELMASGLQENNRALIVGRQTCGCLLGVIGAREIKDGELRISQINVISAKGKRYENVGVTPDAAVELTLEDLQNNRDRALEAAEKMLNESVSRAK